jgi:hypothetical protein
MKLRFIDPTHEDHGEPSVAFSTTRLGNKYAQSLAPGDHVEIADNDGNVIHDAEVLCLYVCPFDWLTEDYIAQQHAPDARTLDGLKAAMERAYGDDFHEDSTVTVIFYELA